MEGKGGEMTPLAEIARQAWLDCPLDGDHWEDTASAVRKAVLERAMDAAEDSAMDNHNRAAKEPTGSEMQLRYYYRYEGGLEAVGAISRLLSATNDREAE